MLVERLGETGTFRTEHRGRYLVAAGAALAVIMAAAAVTAEEPEDALASSVDRAFIVAERQVYGLPVDADTIDQLYADQAWSDEWGIAITNQEAAELDLDRRKAFEHAVATSVLPYVDKLPTYGGMYFDQARDGRLVVGLTAADAAVEAAITGLVPAATRPIEFRQVAHSYAELAAALEAAPDAWSELAPDARLVLAALDVERNAIRIEVADGDAVPATSPSAIAEELGVTVIVEPAGETSAEVLACNSRDDCHSPMRAGIRINSPDKTCTMGFLILNDAGTDREFLTAGHCSYAGLSNQWSHNGYGFIGAVTDTLYEGEVQNNDLMRVEMPNDQGGFRVYNVANAKTVEGRRAPIDGETLVASLGRRAAIDSGVVDDHVVTYTDSNGVFVSGAATMTGVNAISGDSGSPIYHEEDSASEDVLAVGSVSAVSGNTTFFDRVHSSLLRLHWHVFTDPDVP